MLPFIEGFSYWRGQEEAMQMINGLPVLYVCPYCVKGRFTQADGWEAAVKHIRENHNRGGQQRGSRRGRRPSHPDLEDLDLLEEAAFG